ncbi:uncharacterized protein (DUF1684 family) [Leucobacter exalbidus]|uniref:Uncharacterized protein (DUF1684 family) n=1 Tax=Leucobacter exalbidus TaxID=662960 RepID=A0A940PNR4_9MICO|nr:DUF1684 domain-containing protein [Leucobacter exalbidus]MBP1326425.1 uncharacterized protein (DUF1684 family) [Leucobacter exalbidus]
MSDLQPAEPATTAAAAPVATAFSDAHAVWHAEVEAARTAPYGALTATAMHWLEGDAGEARELPGLPGEWRAYPDGLVTVVVTEADGISQAGQPVAGEVRVGPLTGLASATLTWGDILIEIAARSGAIAVRPRDPQAAARVEYTGTPVFAPNRDWVVSAEFESDPRASVEIDSAAAGRLQHYDSPGRAVFTVGGERVALTLFGSAAGGDLRAIFSDASPETFDATRFVGVTAREGGLVIDFNRAVNPPFAYTEHATCPFPPAENRLPVPVEAGEKRPNA